MPKSKYLDKFMVINKELKDKFKLYGDRVLVEEIPKKEATTKGGIIIGEQDKLREGFATRRTAEAIVLAVGEGYYDDKTGEDVPLSVQPGDIVILSPHGTTFYSDFAPIDGSNVVIGVTIEANIQMSFRGEGAYASFFEALTK